MVTEDEKKLKKLNQQIVNTLEESFDVYMRIKGLTAKEVLSSIKDSDLFEKTSNKFVTNFLNALFKEFEAKAKKLEVKSIVASGPVIIENGKLLVNKDTKDDFYKLPGGTVEPDIEDLEEACHRETKEENNGEIEIIRPLHPMIIWKNPQTGEKMAILLIHYLAKLKNPDDIYPVPPIKEVKWLSIKEIKEGKHYVAPNIKFLIEKGDIL